MEVKRLGSAKWQFAKRAKTDFSPVYNEIQYTFVGYLAEKLPEFRSVTCHLTFHVHFLLPLLTQIYTRTKHFIKFLLFPFCKACFKMAYFTIRPTADTHIL
jgi:hypothetical protein